MTIKNNYENRNSGKVNNNDSDNRCSESIENRESYWNNLYSKGLENSLPDNWLECYMHLFRENDRIIELGCGEGFLSGFLLEKGFDVLSTDISESILEKLKTRIPEAETLQLDINKKLPFGDCSFNIIIADLCLHYFSETETVNIIKEVKRILTDGGYFFCRVNSDKDINYGAGEGLEIEEGFYKKNGHLKRFFSKDMVRKYFEDWKSLSVTDKTTLKYEYEKNILQIITEK